MNSKAISTFRLNESFHWPLTSVYGIFEWPSEKRIGKTKDAKTIPSYSELVYTNPRDCNAPEIKCNSTTDRIE